MGNTGKKSFTSGLDQLLTPSADTITFSEPKKENVKEKPKPEKKAEEKKQTTIKATFAVYTETMDTIHALAYYQRKELKSILEDAFSLYIKKAGESTVSEAIKLYKKG